MTITIDNTAYAVGIASAQRSIRREYKYSVTTEDGKVHQEIRATYIDWDLSLGNLRPAAYDALMAKLRSATGNVTITMPKTAAETETYTGIIEGISDGVIVDYGDDGVMWDDLSVSFTGTVPVEVSA